MRLHRSEEISCGKKTLEKLGKRARQAARRVKKCNCNRISAAALRDLYRPLNDSGMELQTLLVHLLVTYLMVRCACGLVYPLQPKRIVLRAGNGLKATDMAMLQMMSYSFSLPV